MWKVQMIYALAKSPEMGFLNSFCAHINFISVMSDSFPACRPVVTGYLAFPLLTLSTGYLLPLQPRCLWSPLLRPFHPRQTGLLQETSSFVSVTELSAESGFPRFF